MVAIIGWNQEEIIPYLVLGNFVLHWFPGKDEPDASAIFDILARMVTVMHLKL